jgi:hypothetical protein
MTAVTLRVGTDGAGQEGTANRMGRIGRMTAMSSGGFAGILAGGAELGEARTLYTTECPNACSDLGEHDRQ